MYSLPFRFLKHYLTKQVVVTGPTRWQKGFKPVWDDFLLTSEPHWLMSYISVEEYQSKMKGKMFIHVKKQI